MDIFVEDNLGAKQRRRSRQWILKHENGQTQVLEEKFPNKQNAVILVVLQLNY